MSYYKGYEIRGKQAIKFVKNGQVIEMQGFGIYSNDDYKGGVLTIPEAQEYIDCLLKGALYRPRERTITRVWGEAWKKSTEV